MSETIEAPAAPEPAAPEADDLRSVLGAAFDDNTADPEPSGTTERDENGRFAKRDGVETPEKPDVSADAEKTDQPEEKADEPADEPAIDAPVSWSAAERDSWKSLPRDAQETILRREQEISTVLEQRAQADKQAEPIRDTLERYRSQYASRGIPPEQAIGALFEAQAMLDRDPVAGIRALAQSYRVDLSQIATTQQQAPQVDPVVMQLHQELETLKARQAANDEAQIMGPINAFAADPAHKYFPEVKTLMGSLMVNGTAETLEAAYEIAIKAHPAISQRLQADADRVQTEARRKAAAEAKTKAGSIRSAAPANGATAVPDSVRAALLSAWG